MKINNHEIKRAESIKLLGVMLDENLTWKPHIKYIENKIAKNIGLLFKAKQTKLYTINIFIAALPMPTWPGDVHI